MKRFLFIFALCIASVFSYGQAQYSAFSNTLHYWNGINLPNPKFVSGYTNVTSTGDVDIYTVPTGKRALLNAVNLYANNGSTTNVIIKVKVSGTYYQLGASQAVTNNTFNTGTLTTVFVGESGETFSVNIDHQPVNLWMNILEFDAANSNLATSKLLTVASGNNTVYQVPSGKTAMLMANVGIGTFPQTTGRMVYGNFSGGTLTASCYDVINGGSQGSTTQVIVSQSVTNTGFLNCVMPLTLASQDSLILNTSANTATQYVWVTHVEY